MFSCSRMHYSLISQKNANPPVKAGNEKKPGWLKMCRTHFFLTQHNECIGTISSDLQTPDPSLLS